MHVERGRLQGAAFEALIDELAQIARDAGGKEPDKAALAESVRRPLSLYAVGFLTPLGAKPSPLGKIARPLRSVLALLGSREHESDLVSTLSSRPGWDQEWAGLRLLTMIEDLHALEKEARAGSQPARPRRGRPRDGGLYFLVHELASVWAATTGEPFTQEWHGKIPLAPGARFVEGAVRFLDPTSLSGLREATKRVVADRRRGKRWVSGKGVTFDNSM